MRLIITCRKQTMGNYNGGLKELLKKYTVLQLSRDMGVSPARVYQWLDGDSIPEYRIRLWVLDPATPAHIRELARKMLGDEQPTAVSH